MPVKYFVYLWTNTRNGKKYIGKHIGYPDDGYIGSGVYFSSAYEKEPENFERTILGFFENEFDLSTAEEKYLNEVDAEKNPIYYNLTNLSGGGNLHKHLSEQRKDEIYAKANKTFVDNCKNRSEENRLEIKQKKQESWKKSPKKDSHAKRTSERRITEEQNKSDEEKIAFSELCKETYWNRTKEEIESHKENISTGVKNSYNTIHGLRESRKEHFKKINVGRIYINKEGITKRIYPEEKDNFLNDGWVLGMSKRK